MTFLVGVENSYCPAHNQKIRSPISPHPISLESDFDGGIIAFNALMVERKDN